MAAIISGDIVAIEVVIAAAKVATLVAAIHYREASRLAVTVDTRLAATRAVTYTRATSRLVVTG